MNRRQLAHCYRGEMVSEICPTWVKRQLRSCHYSGLVHIVQRDYRTLVHLYTESGVAVITPQEAIDND